MAGTAVSFSGAGSTDPQGEALTYAWNFGDGNTGTGVSPSHTYTALGPFTVTLTVTNTSNLSATATSKATIAPGPPVANAGGPYTGVEGVALSFSGAGSTDPQGETLTYAWNFGDTGTGTGVSPSHTYLALGTYTVTLTVTNTSNMSSTATIKIFVPNGRVYGGQQPITGAHVYLFAANTTGYGQASVSLLSAAATGTSDAVGAYVLTGPDGGFFWNGNYICTPGAQIYLYALGGNAGTGTNTAAGLMAVLGNCPSTGNFSAITYFTVNEVTTIAAAYAMAGFATDATHVSSSGTALAKVGIANAFANAANLATLSTGAALATTPAGNGTVPQTEINTLANILADCVETSGPGSNGCQLLFTNAMSGGSTGTAPTDTATAAINIAHNPGANIAVLYGLASKGVFTPKLSAQPNDFTMMLSFTGGGMFNIGTGGLVIDGSGNVWVVGNSITILSSTGAILSGATGYTWGAGIAIDTSGNAWTSWNGGLSLRVMTNSGSSLSGTTGYSGGGLQSPLEIAIDGSGNAWVASMAWASSGMGSGLFEFSSTGSVLSGSNGYTGVYPYEPNCVAIDGSGNAWVTEDIVNAVAKLSSKGVILSGAHGYTGDGLNRPGCLAIDGAGNAWIFNTNDNNIIKMSNSGTFLSGATGFSGGGLNTPYGIAVDGSGNIWIVNHFGQGVVQLNNAGSVLSGANGYTPAGLVDPDEIALDGSGNVWLTNTQTVYELIGVAVPVITPIAAGLPATPTADGSSKLGTRP
jgi:PKD repeat protein